MRDLQGVHNHSKGVPAVAPGAAATGTMSNAGVEELGVWGGAGGSRVTRDTKLSGLATPPLEVSTGKRLPSRPLCTLEVDRVSSIRMSVSVTPMVVPWEGDMAKATARSHRDSTATHTILEVPVASYS